MSQRFLLQPVIAGFWVLALACGASSGAGTAASSEVSTLRRAYAALHKADHDYQGHRHKAMRAIEAACKALGATVEGDGTGQEPQRESDAQLKKAQKLLQGISGNASVKSGAAAKHIHHALNELSIALSIK